MNDRIKELAEQCTVNCIDGRGVELNEIDVEKFAELIVKECAEKIAHNKKFNWLDAAQAAKDLKEHFGVEK